MHAWALVLACTAFAVLFAGCLEMGSESAKITQAQPAQKNASGSADIAPMGNGADNDSSPGDYAPEIPPAQIQRCGNGLPDEGEECDGTYFGCPEGKTCDQNCLCAEKPAPASVKQFPVPRVEGLDSEYGPAQTIQLTVASSKENGQALTPKEGYGVIAYVQNESGRIDGMFGEYDNGASVWKVKYQNMLPAGNYEWKIILVCSKNGTACDSEYGAGNQSWVKLPFAIMRTCTDSDGFDLYVKGKTIGFSKLNDRAISAEDSCENGALTEFVCDGIWARKETVVCSEGCGDGACVASGLSLRIDTGALPQGKAGTPYFAKLAARGGRQPYSGWEVVNGTLPEGMRLDLETGEISGIPMRASETSPTFWVQDSAGNTARKSIGMVVSGG